MGGRFENVVINFKKPRGVEHVFICIPVRKVKLQRYWCLGMLSSPIFSVNVVKIQEYETILPNHTSVVKI